MIRKLLVLIIVFITYISFNVKVFSETPDESEPVDGVYNIYTEKGLQNLYSHPDASFELMNDIDLNGTEWMPVGTDEVPFTGVLSCSEHVISNFTIRNSEGSNLGFFGVNEGTVNKLFLSDVKMIADETDVNIGLYAGINRGALNRCYGEGSLEFSSIPEGMNLGGMAGYNAGNVKNNTVFLEVKEDFDNELSANIGGIVGHSVFGSIRDNETKAPFTVKNSLNKNIGLLVGRIDGGDVKRCAFTGEKNEVDGILYETAIGRKSDSAVTTSLLVRQNGDNGVSEESRKLRNIVVDYMYQMGTILWTVPEQIQTSCVQKCSAEVCHTPLNPGITYRGLPYKHSSSTLDRMEYCLDDNNSLKQWVVDLGNLAGFQTYFGSACYSSVQLAWARVSGTINATCAMEALLYGDYTGCVPVGNWAENWKYKLNDQYTQYSIDISGIDSILEDYALVRAGDAFVKLNSSGAHAIMAATDVVVVRDENGKIDPDYSYLYTHEQGGPNNAPEGIVSSWCINRYKTFSTLLGEAYMPLTIQELIDGKMPEREVKIEGELDGVLGLTTGIISSNYFIDAVTLNITEDGNDFFNKKVYCRVDKLTDYGGGVAAFDRNLVNTYDLALFSRSVQDLNFRKGRNYHVTFTVLLQTGESIVIREYDF